jgi:hemerythrin-like domain-containing protein
MIKAHYTGITGSPRTDDPPIPQGFAAQRDSEAFSRSQRTWCNASGPEKILSLLRRDHDSMRTALRVLADQLDVFCLAGRPEYLFMLEALDYAGNYPNRFHHPNETRLFAALAARSAQAKSNAQVLLDEHVRLTTLSRALTQQVDQILAEAVVNRSRLAACAWEYIAAKRQHMTFEEKVMFPMLEKTFTPSDWGYFERALPFPGAHLAGSEICQR